MCPVFDTHFAAPPPLDPPFQAAKKAAGGSSAASPTGVSKTEVLANYGLAGLGAFCASPAFCRPSAPLRAQPAAACTAPQCDASRGSRNEHARGPQTARVPHAMATFRCCTTARPAAMDGAPGRRRAFRRRLPCAHRRGYNPSELGRRPLSRWRGQYDPTTIRLPIEGAHRVRTAVPPSPAQLPAPRLFSRLETWKASACRLRNVNRHNRYWN